MASVSSNTSRSGRPRAALALALALIAGVGVGVAASSWAAGNLHPPQEPAQPQQEPVQPQPGTAAPEGPGPGRSEPRSSSRIPMLSPAPNRLEDATARLAAAVHAGQDAPAAAAALRRLLRTDAAAFAACRRMLVHGRLESPVRAALALVIGTVQSPDTDDTLLEALAAHRQDPTVLVALLHALGAARTPPGEDQVFDCIGRPWAVAGPGGLGITVSRPIERASVALILTNHLWDRSLPDAARTAAAASLRHSLERPQVLADFRAVLEKETVDGVARGVGEALAAWAVGRRDAHSAAVARELVTKAATPSFHEFRFHVEDELSRIQLDEVALDRITGYLAPGQPYALRSWALEVLGRQPGPAVTRRLCEIAARGADTVLRDAAVRLLGRRQPDDSVLSVLTRILQRDTAWQVRYAALGSLENAPRPQILPALRLATADPDARVRARAREILGLD